MLAQSLHDVLMPCRGVRRLPVPCHRAGGHHVLWLVGVHVGGVAFVGKRIILIVVSDLVAINRVRPVVVMLRGQ